MSLLNLVMLQLKKAKMSDKQISDLNSLTTPASNDLLVVNDTSAIETKSVSLATLINKMPTWLGFIDTADEITTSATVSLTSSVSLLDMSGQTSAISPTALADGSDGQVKIVIMTTAPGSGGSYVLTATNSSFTNVTFNGIGQSSVLMFKSGNWHCISESGATVTR